MGTLQIKMLRASLTLVVLLFAGALTREIPKKEARLEWWGSESLCNCFFPKAGAPLLRNSDCDWTYNLMRQSNIFDNAFECCFPRKKSQARDGCDWMFPKK